jgi:hypothetical protein
MSFNNEYINDTHKIILIYSKKAACSLLHTWFVRNICNISGNDDNRDIRVVANDKKICRKIVDPLQYREYNAYFFIRDPIRRCISCFINKFVIYNGKKIIKFNDLENFIKQYVIQIYKSNNINVNNNNYVGITFNQFLIYIKNNMNKPNFDRHFYYQVNLSKITKYMKHFNTTVIDIDDGLENHLHKINSIYNIKSVNYGKINCTSYSNLNEHINYCDTLSTNIDINNINIDYFSNSYDLIRKIYNNDYLFLNKYLKNKI